MSAQNAHPSPREDGPFVVGEIFLQVEHPADLQEAALLQVVSDLWNKYAPTKKNKEKYEIGKLRLAKPAEGRITSPSHVVIPILDLLEKDWDTKKETDPKDAAIYRLVSEINKSGRFAADQSNITVQSVTPNWLFSPMTHSVGHPSPGGRPVSVDGADIPINREAMEDSKTTSRILTAKTATAHALDGVVQPRATKKAEQHTVNVIIFDTAPTKGAIAAALADSNLYSWLLADLNERLTIFHAQDNGINLPLSPPLNPADHDKLPHYTHKDFYKVSDHGLFIAGIVNRLAPNANIYLVEVLNQYGAGSIESIIQGVKLLTEMDVIIPRTDKTSSVIINFSLSIGFRDATELENMGYIFPTGTDTATLDLESSNELKMLSDALQNNKTVHPQAIIFAAAGNDGEFATDPALARQAYYPAAFKCVKGVGAIDEKGNRAWYSNLSDIPPNTGILVNGGGMDPNGGKHTTDGKNGVLSVYIDEFPSDIPADRVNNNGWAYWSGTSFASAHMSGMFAAADANGRSLAHDLFKNFTDQAVDFSDRNEPILKGK